MKMKKILALTLIMILALSLSACSLIGWNDSPVTSLEDKYPGYYATFEDGVISVTNYHPYDFDALPAYQELIEYGDGAGMENEGTVYFVYVLDTKKTTTDNEVYYYAELADETREVLIEENSYFASAAEKDAAVSKLMEIMEYVKETYPNQ